MCALLALVRQVGPLELRLFTASRYACSSRNTPVRVEIRLFRVSALLALVKQVLPVNALPASVSCRLYIYIYIYDIYIHVYRYIYIYIYVYICIGGGLVGE